MSSHRLPEITLKRSSGDSKLMNSPFDSSSNARRNLRLIFSREDTSNVTVRISRPPCVHIVPEIIEHLRINCWLTALLACLCPVYTPRNGGFPTAEYSL